MNDEVQVSAELNVSYDDVPAIPIGFPQCGQRSQEKTLSGYHSTYGHTLVNIIILHCLGQEST